MEQNHGKCWKLPIFEGKLQVFFSYLSEMKTICSITLPYSSTFYRLFLPFFVLEIFKFKYNKFFVRHSASISKFEWSEQLCSHPFNSQNLLSVTKVFCQCSLTLFCGIFRGEALFCLEFPRIKWQTLKNPKGFFFSKKCMGSTPLPALQDPFYCMRCPFSKYFQILFIFAQIFKYFALFCHFLTFFCPLFEKPHPCPYFLE